VSRAYQPIEVEGLRRAAGGREALRGVSLAVSEGEAVALVGPNQSGKSLFAKILAGELAPSAGRARVLGLVPWEEPKAVRRQIGYLPEEDLFGDPDARVIDYLLFAARLKELPRGQRTRSIERAISAVKLEALEGTPLSALSKSERRRVLFAQALLGEPRVLLLDAPFEGLDARTTHDLVALLRELSADRAVLLVTNRIEEAAQVAARLVVLSKGEVAAAGTPREIALKAQEGGAREVVRVAPPPGVAARDLCRPLLDIPGVRAVTPTREPEGLLALTVLATRDVRAQVISALCARGAEVVEAREVEGLLGAAYQALTAPKGDA
jgi:ABC-2 type transport system ATP-binding protein